MGAHARIERMWDLATTHTIVWPTGLVDTERLARACATIAASAEHGSYVARRIAEVAAAEGLTPGCLLDRDGARFVRTAGCRTRDELVAELSRGGRGGLPFGFVVCPDGFALVHSHELGDGSVSAALLAAVLCAYSAGGGARPVPGRVARDRDLVRALLSLWVRRPRTVGDTVAGVVRRRGRRPASATHIAAGSGVRLETWAVDDADTAVLDRWRHEMPGRPSMSVALLWTVARALVAHGYPAGPQRWQVVVGMRGAAPVLAGLGGNLVGRALIDVDPGGDPVEPAVQLRLQGSGGEVVALHLLKLGARHAADAVGWLRSRARGARGAGRERPVRLGNTPGLSWSDRGRYAFGEGFAATVPTVTADGRTVVPYVYTFVTPGIDGISVNVNWIDGRPGLLLSFGASPLDDAAVDAVLRSLRGGVGALLDPVLATADDHR